MLNIKKKKKAKKRHLEINIVRIPGLPCGSVVKNLPANAERHGFNPWDGKISWRRKWQLPPVILAWEIPWTEEPGGLQSMGSQRVRH